jgi:hypothetical protein
MHNMSLVPRSMLLRELMTRKNPIRSSLRYLLPEDVRQHVWRFVRKHNLKRPPHLDPEIRRELTKDYREDIGLVERLVGRDLSQWLKDSSN